MLSEHLLSITIFLPLAGAILLLFFSRPADEAHTHGQHGDHTGETAPAKPDSRAQVVRIFTLVITIVTFVASLGLLFRFVPNSDGFQLTEGPRPWISQFGVNYHVGIDGFSLLLILLTTFTSVLAVYYSFTVK